MQSWNCSLWSSCYSVLQVKSIYIHKSVFFWWDTEWWRARIAPCQSLQPQLCLRRTSACWGNVKRWMFVFWFLRGGATLLLTSPLLHVCFPCSSFLILPADVWLPHSSLFPIRDQRSTLELMQRFPLFKIYSRPPADVTKGLHSLTSRPKSGKRPTLATFARLRVQALHFTTAVSQSAESRLDWARFCASEARSSSIGPRARVPLQLRAWDAQKRVLCRELAGFWATARVYASTKWANCKISNVGIYSNNTNRLCCMR